VLRSIGSILLFHYGGILASKLLSLVARLTGQGQPSLFLASLLFVLLSLFSRIFLHNNKLLFCVHVYVWDDVGTGAKSTKKGAKGSGKDGAMVATGRVSEVMVVLTNHTFLLGVGILDDFGFRLSKGLTARNCTKLLFSFIGPSVQFLLLSDYLVRHVTQHGPKSTTLIHTAHNLAVKWFNIELPALSVDPVIPTQVDEADNGSLKETSLLEGSTMAAQKETQVKPHNKKND